MSPDASHELKTLASIRLLADSILQSEEMDWETLRTSSRHRGGGRPPDLGITEYRSLTRLDSLAVGRLRSTWPLWPGGPCPCWPPVQTPPRSR